MLSPSLTKEDSESKSMCLTCNKCFFDARYDLCVVQYLSEVNDRARAKVVKSIKMKEWKPTGKMFKNVGYKWVPIRRTFTIVGTKCPLTRFTSTKVVPPRKPIKLTVITNIKPSSASQWRPKEINHVSSSNAPKIVKSRTANHLEPNNHMGSNVSISLWSSSVQCSQNQRDLPWDIPLDSVVVLRYENRSKSENNGKVPTEIELVLEQTQQGTSYKVSVSAEGVEELKRKVKINGEKKEGLLTLRQKLEHQSDTKVFTMMMEILLEPTSNKLMVGDLFNTTVGNPVKEILLKLNLPDHRSILTNSKEYIKRNVESLPKVYENEADNGSSHIYLTSPLHYRKKVNIVRQNEGPVMLQGNNWKKFIEENFNQNVALLHFIEEGEDNFYVTRYYGNGCEVIGYDDLDIRNRRPRFMSRILGVEFLRDLPANNMIRIKGNGINFDVRFTLVPLEAEDDGHGYKLNEVDDRMKHRCQWAWHRDHFEEDFHTFYKPYPEIEVKERLAIPSDFMDIHPMHMYTKALMRHNRYEQMMRVKWNVTMKLQKGPIMLMSLEGGGC
ncbi:hypothetical protein Tco_0549621 [Tanacetum coccineum]